MSGGIAVKLVDLHISYGKGKTEVEALKGLTANIAEGRITGLVGPDASGKTTLMRCLRGCFPQLPAARKFLVCLPTG